MKILLIGLGGAIGAICRYYLSALMNKANFPMGTWIINISGSFLLGVLFGLERTGWPMWLFGIGFCGAFTTMSTFANETVGLFVSGQTKTAFLYVASSLVFSLLAAWFGLFLHTFMAVWTF